MSEVSNGHEMEPTASEAEPLWVSAPEWKFWLAYLNDMDQRRVEPPAIDTFHHVPAPLRARDEERVKEWFDRYFAERRVRAELRAAGQLTEAQVAAREVQLSLGPTGHLLERILGDLCERQDLFGGGMVLKTSRFDDLFNGVDAVVEWPRDRKTGIFPRLGVDFSVANSSKRTREKRHKVENGVRVKYFRSHLERDRGHAVEMTLFVPAVVIRVSRDSFRDLARDSEGKRLDDVLKSHPLREEILRQITTQLESQVHAELREIDSFRIRLEAGEEIDSVLEDFLVTSREILDLMTGSRETTDRVRYVVNILKKVKNAKKNTKS